METPRPLDQSLTTLLGAVHAVGPVPATDGAVVAYHDPFCDLPRPAQAALQQVLGVHTGQAILAAGDRLVIATLKNHGVGCGARVVADVHRWLAEQRQSLGAAVPTTTQTKAQVAELLSDARARLAGAIRRRLVEDGLDVEEVARTCGSTQELVQRVARGEVPSSLDRCSASPSRWGSRWRSWWIASAGRESRVRTRSMALRQVALDAKNWKLPAH